MKRLSLRRFGFLALACMLAPTSVANAKPKAALPLGGIPSGIYSSVTESEETGDRGGIEFRLYTDATRPYVEAVVCESECNGGERYYLTPTPDGFRFTWKNPRFAEDNPVTFRVWKKKRDVWIVGENEAWMKEKLKRLKQPLGLLGAYDWAQPGCDLNGIQENGE